MLLRRSTDIYPKELARDMRQFFNRLLATRGLVKPQWRDGRGKTKLSLQLGMP